MELLANAKINLTLDILRKREDGYHDLQMVMQAVTLADTLNVVPAQEAEGQAVSDLHFLPTGSKNLAQMAAAAFRQATGLGGEVDVSIQKRVPVCAGLAGGSADAAAVLTAMNQLTGAGLSPPSWQKSGSRWAPTCPSAYWAAPPWPRAGGNCSPLWPPCPLATSPCANRPSPSPRLSSLAG